MDSLDKKGKSILYVVSDDWYFCSHRLPIAIKARDSGFNVHVICNINDDAEKIKNLGFHLLPMTLVRNSLNPFQLLFALTRVIFAVRKIKPTIIQGVAAKPILLAMLASIFSKKSKVVNQLPGLGVLAYYRFQGVKRFFSWCLFAIIVQFFKRLKCNVIVQNSDDYNRLARECEGSKSEIILIKGSGVDSKVFYPIQALNQPKSVALVARMIKTKGIDDFVSAAKIIWGFNKSYRFLLVGDTDLDNADGISKNQLESYSMLPNVEWLGKISDVRKIWARSCIACLPTKYPEGIPMSLLEAAACGRPIVSSDVPGCLEIVKDGRNGFVVPQNDPTALANALLLLLEDDDLCAKYGLRGRELVMANFDKSIIESETLDLYQSLLLREI